MGRDVAIALEQLVVGRSGEPLCGPLALALGAGEALVVTGANGSGKSTLLRTLAGLVPALRGHARIRGAVAADGEPASGIGEAAHYLGHRNALKGAESVGTNLRFWHRFHRGPGEAGGAVAQALAAIGLEGVEPLPLAHLSAGQQRRVTLARLLLAPRPVWLLDEPTGALDERSRERFAGICAAHLSAGGLLVAATHMPLGVPGRVLDLGGPS